jgi:hypothetical protein
MAARSGADRSGLRTLLVAAAGAVLGGFVTAAAINSEQLRSEAAERAAEEVAYVAVQRMTLPVVDRDGALASYMTVDFALEVPADKRVHVRQRVPEVRHAVNLAAWKTRVIATDARGLDIEETRAMLLAASRRALGADAVKEVRVLTAVPV